MTLSGLRNTTTIFCKEGPDYSIYQSDEYGFNNNFMYGDYVKKKFKLLFIGDSFTHGACVNNEKNIPSVVNNHIIKNSGVKDNYVLNLGFSGYGPLTEYVVLREFINNIQFDSLVWLYFEGNDLDDLNLELSNKYLLKYLSDLSFKYDYFNSKDKVDRYLYSKHKEAVEYLKKDNIFNIINFLKLNKTRTFINKNILKVKLKKKKDKINDVSRYKELIKEFENILIQTKFILTKNNVNFNFVYIPSYISFLDTETKNIFIQNSDFNSILINNNHFRDEIINVMKNLEINYIDIYKEIIEANIDPLDYFPQKKINHFNESGYKFIGDLINKKFN